MPDASQAPYFCMTLFMGPPKVAFCSKHLFERDMALGELGSSRPLAAESTNDRFAVDLLRFAQPD